MTMSPAAGPLMVSWELLMRLQTMPPMTAVQIPAMGGYLQAEAMPRHRGSAIRKTRKPESRSTRQPGAGELSGVTVGSAEFMQASEREGGGQNEGRPSVSTPGDPGSSRV